LASYIIKPDPIQALQFSTIPELKAWLKKYSKDYKINSTEKRTTVYLSHHIQKWQLIRIGDYVVIFGDIVQVIDKDNFERCYILNNDVTTNE
jgi:hypothetical protein